MKKTLLIFAFGVAAIATVSAQGQKVWTFESAPFEVKSYVANTELDGLTILAASGKNVDIDANGKKNGDYSFTHRLKLGGAATVDKGTAPWLPTERAVKFNVSGAGLIKIAALSSSSSADRRLILSNGTDSLYNFSAPGTYSADGNTVPLESYQYTGGAATLYLWSPSSGVNIYLISAPALQTSVEKLQLQGISFNGREVINENKVGIEVYNLLGNKIAESNANISMERYSKGIYFVKVSGTKEVMKINR
ncbi:MAG: hypothetical protein BGP01_12965 [Paludibacter sp. 47-17]|nr:MAG: hypothetical protein BGP01_12965 [Paludibacter sp. 47-17]